MFTDLDHLLVIRHNWRAIQLKHNWYMELKECKKMSLPGHNTPVVSTFLDNSAQMQIVKTGTNIHRLLCTSDKLSMWWLNQNTHRIVTKFIKGIQKSSCILYWLHMLSWEEIVCKLDHLLLKGKHQWKNEFLVIKDNTMLVLQISWANPKWKGQQCLSSYLHVGVYFFQ